MKEFARSLARTYTHAVTTNIRADTDTHQYHTHTYPARDGIYDNNHRIFFFLFNANSEFSAPLHNDSSSTTTTTSSFSSLCVTTYQDGFKVVQGAGIT
jgi:hypothetical protein